MALPMKEMKLRAKAVRAEWVAGKTAPQLLVEFTIKDPAFAGERFTNYFNFTGGAFKYSMQSLRTMGLKHDDLDQIVVEEIGADVDLVLAPEEYQGKTNLRLKFVNDPNFTGGAKKADASSLRAFAEQAKAQIKFHEQRDAEAELGPPPNDRPEPPPISDDDLRF